MVYKSPVKNIYYQGTSGGRPNTPRTNELEQVAKALSNFEKDFRSFGKSYVSNKQKVAQDVFEQLKAEGITDPDEIKELIKKGDPRVKGLDSQYAAAVTDVNFGMAHAMEDTKSIETNVIGENLAKINLDEQFESVNRSFDGMSSSYIRGYNEVFDKFRIEINGKKLEADALQLIQDKKSTFYTQLNTSLNDLDNNEDRLKAIEMLIQTKESEGFLSFDQMNETVLNYLENQVGKWTTVGGEPTILDFVTKALTSKRGKNGQLPSFIDNKDTAEQSIKILSAIKTAVNKGTKIANVEKMFFDGVGHKEIWNGVKITETDKKLAQDNIYNKIIELVDEEAKIWEDNPANRGETFPREDKVNAYISSIMSKNAIVFYPWKEDLELGVGLINNTNLFQIDQVPQFIKAYDKFKMLKRLGQDNNPSADYLTGKEEIFYEGVLSLENNGMELNDAVAKMWQIQNMPNVVKIFENPDSTIQSAIEDKFKFIFKDDADTTFQVQEAIRIAKIFTMTGTNETLARKKAIEMIKKSYIAVDGILWNKRKMAGLDGDARFHAELTKKSMWLSTQVADKSKGFYKPEDLVLAPWFGNMFVVMDRHTMAPVSIEGEAFAFSYTEIFNNSSVLNQAWLDQDWNKILTERNDKLIELYSGIYIPDIKTKEELELYNQLQEDFKVIKE